MRYALVTETWPPEVNGVALTVQALALGLHARGHRVQVVRPIQPGVDTGAGDRRLDTLLLRGAALPRYTGLRFGLPPPTAQQRHRPRPRPDAV